MPDKISKDEAEYRKYPANLHYCRDCSMYRKPNKCTLVNGFIEMFATCRFWERKRDD